MKTINAFLILIYVIVLKIILSPLGIIVWTLGIIETVFRITKETMTFFIKQIESEVL
tara:strand:- start:486 stop:656 length:171 start_codon:yes stop_codon:yes gene_type:complete